METILIQLKHAKARKLLEELEETEIIKLLNMPSQSKPQKKTFSAKRVSFERNCRCFVKAHYGVKDRMGR